MQKNYHMKIFYAESAPHYNSYTFPYGIYCLPETPEDYCEAYDSGFLPYTGNPDLRHSIFYKARSLRISLEKFDESSESRRLARKFGNISISIREGTKELMTDPVFLNFALEYASERFQKGELGRERLDYLLSRPYLTGIKIFALGDEDLAYLLYCAHGRHFHYWFSFYSLNFPNDLPLGKYVMWRSIHHAMEKGFKYIYLGTCYGSKSLYKARDFKGVEFHDGNIWIPNLKQLKTICKLDDENALICADRLKISEDQNAFIRHLTGGNHNSVE